RERQLAVPGGVPVDDGDLATGRQRQRLRERADADLGALQIRDQRERLATFLLELANELRPRSMILVCAVREIEARGVHTGGDQGAEGLRRRARRADRRDDLRAARR